MLKQFLKIQNYLMVLRSGKNDKTLNVVFDLFHENKMLKTIKGCMQIQNVAAKHTL